MNVALGLFRILFSWDLEMLAFLMLSWISSFIHSYFCFFLD